MISTKYFLDNYIDVNISHCFLIFDRHTCLDDMSLL